MSLDDIAVPSDAPGPSDNILSQSYRDRLVIYDTRDGGWGSRLTIRLDDPNIVLDVNRYR